MFTVIATLSFISPLYVIRPSRNFDRSEKTHAIVLLFFQVQEISLIVTIPCLGLAFIIRKLGRVFASLVPVSLKYL